jgi:hypothetical protein
VIASAAVRLLAAVAALAFVTAAHAQDFPKHPITMIVPFAAGGTSDVIARTVAEEMGKSLGQPIVIENVAGAGGSTALARAARAEADGYTIAIGNAGTSAATYTIYPKLPFTPESFAPIAVVAKTFGIVALRKDFPARDLKEFIAYAEFPDLQEFHPGRRHRRHAGRLSRRRAGADGCDRRADRRRLRRGGLGVAGDRRQAGEGPGDRLDDADGVAAGPADLGGSRPARIRGAGLERPVRAQGHAARDHRQTQRSCAQGGGERAGEEALWRIVDGRPRRQRACA